MTITLLASIGQVTALQGTAELSRNAKQFEVTKGMMIEINDHLKTQERSKTQIILNDETIITVGPNSDYFFEDFQEGSDPKVMMRLQHGFFKAVTGKIGKIAPQRFKIKTKAATIGIRGTQFMASVQNDEEKIGCIQGVIIVWTKDGEYTIEAGKMIIYKEKKWQIYAMDMKNFAPVMIGMPLKDRYHRFYTKHLLPNINNDYIFQEQLLDSGEPFTFDFNSDNSQPPPFGP
jgi:hypothetical protein